MFYWNDISVKTDTWKLRLYKQMKNIGNITFVVTVYIEVNSEFSHMRSLVELLKQELNKNILFWKEND